MQGHKCKWLLVFPLKNYSAAFTFLKLIFILRYFSFLFKPFIAGANGTEIPESPTEIFHSTVALCFKPKYFNNLNIIPVLRKNFLSTIHLIYDFISKR